MEKQIINKNSIIRCYFDDLLSPTLIEYVISVNGRLISLAQYPADMNDLVDIQEMSMGPVQECRDESFHLYYYEVRNNKFPTPFDDEMIPTKFI